MSLQYIEARHAVIAWRNRWLNKVDESFNKWEVNVVRCKLISEIDSLSWVDKLFTDDFVRVKLISVLSSWSDYKEKSLVCEARQDLPIYFRGSARFSFIPNFINSDNFLAHANIFSAKLNSKEKLKEGVDLKIHNDFIFNKKGSALRQMLRKAIDKVAEDILMELKHKEVNHAA